MIVANALRQSMLAVIKSPAFGHPAFWAPYALVGEGGDRLIRSFNRSAHWRTV